MKTATVFAYQLLLSAFAAAVLFAFAAPAHALDVNTQTVQLLPPGQNTCAPIQVSGFTPYIYDGALNSFEFTVSDPSYVAVVGSAGETSIPLRQMLRMTDASGGVRYHMDINSTSLYGSVPVTVTLLSAKSGTSVCASVLSVDLGSGLPAPSSPSAPSAPVSPAPKPVPAAPAATSAPAAAPAPSAAATAAGSATKALCVSDASAYRLWLVLLVIYALVVGGLLWLEFPVSWSWARTPERVAGAILGLLVLLLAFWYLSEACRAALWMPLLAFLIAALGLLAAFWNHPRVTQLLLEEKRTIIVTPPPQQKK